MFSEHSSYNLGCFSVLAISPKETCDPGETWNRGETSEKGVVVVEVGLNRNSSN